jgi:hypothetical protein
VSVAHAGRLLVRLLLSFLAVLWLGTGCTSVDSGWRAADASQVAADPEATAAEIVGAGQLQWVLADDQGHLLRLYSVYEDDEGPRATAWEVRNEQGAVLHQQVYAHSDDKIPSSPELALSLPQGFLIGTTGGVEGSGGEPSLTQIGSDGKATEARLDAVPTTTAAGDVLLREGPYDHRWFYRPSDDTVHRLPPAPQGKKFQDAAIDQSGTLWLGDLLGRSLEVWWSSNGRDGWRHIPGPRAPRHSTTDFVIGGNAMWVGNFRWHHGGERTGFIYRMSTTAPGAWKTIELGGSGLVYAGDYAGLGTGELLVRSRQGWWTVGDTGLHKLALPGPAPSPDVFFSVDRARLWAQSSAGDLSFSTDGGASWQHIP